jgi:probable phosphoglycerate mutase
MRHGQTSWNAEKRIQGSGDSPLTDAGVATCKRWGAFLAANAPAWHRLIVSPLQRALDTAHILNAELGLPIEVETGYREQDWGQWEGLTVEDIKQNFPGELEKRIGAGWDFRPPGGESRREVLQRVLETTHQQASRWPGSNLIVVTHLGVIKGLLYHIENRDYLPEEPKIIWKSRFHCMAHTDKDLWLEQTNICLPDTV